MTVDWCPEGWTLVKLGDLGEVNRGRSRHRPRYAEHLYDGPYPFIQTGDIKASGGKITTYQQTYSEAGLAQSRLWPAGTMCITIAANIAETGILTFPACFPDSVVGFIADDSKCDVRFVEYMFRYLKRRIQHEATGSVQDNINLATLARLWFPLPPLSKQRAITHILGTLDDKIELNQQMNRELEAIAQAIFKSWFVDFGPVRAKMECRQPAGMDDAIAALFPDSFEDSQMGDIPKGWRVEQVKNIAEVTDFVANGSFATLKQNVKLYDEPEYAIYVRTTDFKNGFSGQLKYTNYDAYEFLKKSRLHGEEVIISNVGDTGTVFRPPVWLEKPMTLGSNAIAVRGREYGEFLFHYFSSFPGQKDILSIVSGSAQPKFNKTDFRALKLAIPSQKLLSLFGESAKVNWQRQVANYRETWVLTAIRDALLPKLLSGEIRVKEAEKFVEAAA